MTSSDGPSGDKTANDTGHTMPQAILTDAPAPSVTVFARKLAHDLNNFATVVRTYSELLLADLPPGSTHDDVSEIHRASDAMVAYLQRIARFARTNSLRPTEFALAPVVQSVIAELNGVGSDAPIQLEGESATTVHVDQAWLRDVLKELLVNAREAAPASTPVSVILRDAHDSEGVRWVVCDVRDSGSGFASTVSSHPEDPFATTKDGVRGAGFGLTLASAFANASQGRLVRSRVGEQTSVALWLRVRVS